MDSLEFSICDIYITLSANSGSFTSSFPIWMPFVSFSCIMTLASTCSIMLNKSDKVGRLCLVSDLRGKAFSFLPLSLMLVVDLS